MPPSPTPTESQIEATREVAGENSYDMIEELIGELNNSQWARALELLTAWDEYPEGDTTRIEGGKEGIKDDPEMSRGDVRVRMRLLLGLPEYRDSSLTGLATTRSVRNLAVW